MREQIVYLSEQLWASQHELAGLKDAPTSDTDRLRCSSELRPPAAEPKAASALNGVLRWLPHVKGPPLRRSIERVHTTAYSVLLYLFQV